MKRKLTDPNAVELVIEEFDRLGRDEFLRKYKFGPAKTHYIEHNGHRYDSKAIYGVAHGIQFPEDGALISSDFSGGVIAVRQPLEDMGFKFAVVEPQPSDAISSNNVALIKQSRGKGRYTELSNVSTFGAKLSV